MNKLLTYTLNSKLNTTYVDAIPIYDVAMFKEIGRKYRALYPVGYRLGIVNKPPKEAVAAVLTGLDRVSVTDSMIIAGSGTMYIDYLKTCLSTKSYIHFSYPPNPFESLGGLFSQGLLIPAFTLYYNGILKKVYCYDSEKREYINITNYTGRLNKPCIIIKLYLRRFRMGRGYKPEILYSECIGLPIEKLVLLDSRIDASIFIKGRHINIITYVYTSKYGDLIRGILNKYGCRTKYIDLDDLDILPTIYKDQVDTKVRFRITWFNERTLRNMIYLHIPSMLSIVTEV